MNLSVKQKNFKINYASTVPVSAADPNNVIATYDLNLKQYVKAREIILVIPNVWTTDKQSTSNLKPVSNLSAASQPIYCFLRSLFTNLVCYVGKNQRQVENTNFMDNQQDELNFYTRINMAIRECTENEQKYVLSQFGLPWQNTFCCTDPDNANKQLSYPSKAATDASEMDTIGEYWNKNKQSFWYDQMYSTVKLVSTFKASIKFYKIPLYLIIPWFDGDFLLPPYFRIKLIYNTNSLIGPNNTGKIFSTTATQAGSCLMVGGTNITIPNVTPVNNQLILAGSTQVFMPLYGLNTVNYYEYILDDTLKHELEKHIYSRRIFPMIKTVSYNNSTKQSVQQKGFQLSIDLVEGNVFPRKILLVPRAPRVATTIAVKSPRTQLKVIEQTIGTVHYGEIMPYYIDYIKVVNKQAESVIIYETTNNSIYGQDSFVYAPGGASQGMGPYNDMEEKQWFKLSEQLEAGYDISQYNSYNNVLKTTPYEIDLSNLNNPSGLSSQSNVSQAALRLIFQYRVLKTTNPATITPNGEGYNAYLPPYSQNDWLDIVYYYDAETCIDEDQNVHVFQSSTKFT
jgi:hypothetical protein